MVSMVFPKMTAEVEHDSCHTATGLEWKSWVESPQGALSALGCFVLWPQRGRLLPFLFPARPTFLPCAATVGHVARSPHA